MGKNKKTFTLALQTLKRERRFQDFCDFFVEKLELSSAGKGMEELRREAYHLFRERTERQNIAAVPTMKRWFGIGGNTSPDREQVYRICFLMGMSALDAQEYLVYGIHEPAFQVNDYREVILVYGLENQISYDICMDYIADFEKRLSYTVSFLHTSGTQVLLGEFHGRKHLPWEEFREWMLENAANFKGYSKTTMDYFLKYKKLILEYAKRDAREEMERLLSETDYEIWCRMRLQNPGNYKKNVLKYIRVKKKGKDGKFSEDLAGNIKELYSIAYTTKQSNVRLLSEVFQLHKVHCEKIPHFATVHNMTEKHLSDLLNVPMHKERLFRVRQAELQIDQLADGQTCPRWIRDMGREYGRQETPLRTVREAREWLAYYRRENKRRCLLIQRSDLLPLVMYVAQHRYLDSIGQDMSKYDQNDALDLFHVLADSTLAACNMCRLDEAYELDAVLCACYQPEEMFGYSDLLEMRGKVR